MRSPVARGVRGLVRTTQSMVSQIVVSVAAAVCVAFITNAYLMNGSEDAAASSHTPALAEIAAPADGHPAGALPPLDMEVIADIPGGIAPGQEVFPGAPAGVRPEALQQAVAEKRSERRRFLGIPIPFTSTASDIAEDRVSGG